MGKINSHADVMADWEELLDAVRRSPDLLPDVAEDIEILAGLLTRARELKARQNELAGLRQEATQKLNAEVIRGKETAIRMRSVVRGKIGPRSERLVQFGVAPLRKRRRPVRSRPPERPQGDGGLSLRNDPQDPPDAGVEARPGVGAVEVVACDLELAPGAVGDEAVGVAGRMDDPETEGLAGVGLEDRPVAGERRLRPPAAAVPERLGAVVDRLLAACSKPWATAWPPPPMARRPSPPWRGWAARSTWWSATW
ncbi:MAG: hypothetical protein ACJ76N_10605 [Thermoanaerobaculia bacterium]